MKTLYRINGSDSCIVSYYRYFVMISALVAMTLLTHSTAQGKGYVSKKELLEVFSNENIDNIIATLNDVRKMNYQGDVLPILLSVWEGDVSKYPDLLWGVLQKDIVRVEVANVLLQARRNGLIQLDKDEFRPFLREAVRSSDVKVQTSAIWTLGILNDRRDIQILLEIGLEEDRVTFPWVVSALNSMWCHQEASRALDRLEAEISAVNLRDEVKESRDKWRVFSKGLDRRFCE